MCSFPTEAVISPVIPLAEDIGTNPTELASVVFGLLHYAEFVVQRPVSTEASSVGFVPSAPASGFRRVREPDASAFRLMTITFVPFRPCR